MKLNNAWRAARKPGMLITAAILTAGMGSIVTADDAQAYGGKENSNTGIVWGVGQDGSYMVPLKSGGEKQGWCIDPGAAYPKQNGPYGSKNYGAPQDWATNMSAADKKKLSVALIIGKGLETGVINKETAGLINGINVALREARNGGGALIQQAQALPEPFKTQAINAIKNGLSQIPNRDITTNPDKLAAGVSGVVHDVGSRNKGADAPPYTKSWSASRITDADARQVYDIIQKYSQFIPNELLPQMNFKIRKSEGNGRQRMVLMDDIKIDWNVNWTPPTFPTGTPDTDEPKTPTESTTPGTTTPGTTTPSTTPRTTPDRPDTPETPEIRTSAGTKSENIAEQGSTITDTVTYKGLEKGEEYRITGETVSKATGEKDGNKGETEFTAESSDGRIDVPIKLEKAVDTELVVFETLEKKEDGEWVKVAEHADVNDQAQTVGSVPRTPQIGTSAESNTGNNIQTGTTVNDTVRYQGLVPGQKYKLEARLMCKATGQDTGATQSKEFTASEANGQEVVENIAVKDPDCLEQVVFEKLYDDKGYLVATHEDINDAAQTFGGEQTAKKKKKEVPSSPAPAPNGPIAQANADSESHPAAPVVVPLGAPAPAGIGGAPDSAPARQNIGSVPSGESAGFGRTLFG